MRRLPPIVAILVVFAGLLAVPRFVSVRAGGGPDFVHFESNHVHPLALTPDGTRLLVVNTPDNRLSVFDVTGATPVRVADDESPFRMMVPPMKLREFTFTSLSDAV
jgi:6-phosphogluconolactonase (cycloisomerase 2 family)